MNYTIIKKLPPVEDILREMPLSDAGYERIAQDREEVCAILEGRDPRMLMIVGPCSAWPNPAVLEYAKRLVALNQKVKEHIKVVMRVYIQKPRTTRGWTGPVNQPDPFAYPDIEEGVRYTRKLMVNVIEMGLPIADEALFTHNAKGFLELLSWVAIGARSAEDQEHRIFASAIDCPVGLKNPTHGSLAVGVNSIVAAQYPHVAVFDGCEVQTNGNRHAHLVLRGGDGQPNYSNAHLEEIKRHMALHKVLNPAVVIDASHDNCLMNGKKDHHLQPNVIHTVLDNLKERPDLAPLVKGFMVESFIKEGNQKVDPNNPGAIDLGGLSITDPCMGWDATENMLLELADRVGR
ncbi:MAG: 3-deoxy-7-phosphoheptulonate synthase [Deltaproteobacteria bacterium CG11_big_fil_rev_8_21_14_0_20_47_16]|nr:MAG: 3-deoxy-7-phosphoheptulonate synthase [Deltaproteobacteria bacterium CG11_big_fil_rev_8_21_14_0_20_47_16]